MSNYPDDMNWKAHDARYGQADCLVDCWHRSRDAMVLIERGAGASMYNNEAGYRAACDELDAIRDQAFDDCNCGNCENSDNWTTDGESLINDAMVSA